MIFIYRCLRKIEIIIKRKTNVTFCIFHYFVNTFRQPIYFFYRMVRVYKRKTDRAEINVASLKKAVLEVVKNGRKSRKEKMSQLDFRREIANVYLKKYQVLPKRTWRTASIESSSESRISNDVRFDQTDHFVQHTPENKKRPCAASTCKSIVRTMCAKCDVALCINCFKPFHLC